MGDERLQTVNVNKVAKNVSSIGLFGLFQIDGLNLIATHWFMLKVSEEQFWKIQCKLEAKQKNVWLFKSKEGIRECNGANPRDTCDLYSKLVYEDQAELLKRTTLTYGSIEVFTDERNYFGIPVKYLDMLDYSPTVKHAAGRESVIVDDIHVFTIVKRENTESPYLRPLI